MNDRQARTKQPTPKEYQAHIACQRATIVLLCTHVKVLRMQLDEYEKKDVRIFPQVAL